MSEETTEIESREKKGTYKRIFGRNIFIPLWVTSRLVPILLLVFVAAIVGVVFYLYHYRPDKVEEIRNLGYLGIFLISVIMNATLILPVGNMVVLVAMSTMLPPIMIGSIVIPVPICLGVIGGIGAAIGESTGYLAGYSGQTMVDENKKKKDLYIKLETWLNKFGMLLIIVMSGVPLAFDVMGLVAGALKYPYWKFLVGTAIGRAILYSLATWLFIMGIHIFR